MRVSTLLCCAALALAGLGGCASRPVQAPVLDRAPPAAVQPKPAATSPPRIDTRPEFYTIRRGDTMFSIALDHGLDYKELAAWNNLDNPNLIRPGQQLRIKPPTGIKEAPVIVSPVAGGAVTVKPVTTAGRVETRPLGGSAARMPATQEPVKTEPVARKLPYSPENIALLQRSETPPTAAPAAITAPAPAPASAASPKDTAAKPDTDVDDEDKVDWGWPARGKVVAGFSEATNKGLDIAGSLGDPVSASAPGRVVYSGSGLRGYGKLVIIKHNKTFLSAYAHNKDILVKEGQSVVKGQKIAEVGNTDSDRPKLHFEIRKLGKPVDPAKYLPPT